MNRRCTRDDGVVLVFVALGMVALLLIVAIVIDLGYTRSDRRAGQLAVDNAASSAGKIFAETDNATTACNAAIAYLESTVEESFTITSAVDCTALGTDCLNNPQSPVTASAAGGDLVVEIHHPVIDTSPLMGQSSTIGAESSSFTSDLPGTPCERIGVQLRTNGGSFFGGIAGDDDRTSLVHAVARVEEQKTVRRLNLLVLDRHDCQTFTIGGQGTVIVAPTVDLDNPPSLLGGIAGVDSDGSGCNATKATIEASGQGILRADGPCDTDDELSCEGKGEVHVVAPFTGTGSCAGTADLPACTDSPPSARIDPDVLQITEPFTRAPVDHRYNCKSDYSTEGWASPSGLDQSIAGCKSPTANTDYIDELKAYAAALDPTALPAGWNLVSGGQCQSNSDQVFADGNTYVDCTDFQVKARAEFPSGNIVFGGKVSMTGSGHLIVNSCAGAATPACPGDTTFTWTKGQNFDESTSSKNTAWIYAKGLIQLNSGTADLYRTVLYLASTGELQTTGGAVTWIAPNGGPFSDLALWSASTSEHKFTGAGDLDLRGAFFAGEATLSYAGQGNQVLDKAQFIANKMDFSGKGAVTLAPAPGGIEFPLDPLSTLIR